MYLSENAILQGGKYKIVRFLSSGGFGNTYEGVHTMMDTRVAIKEFFPKMFCNRDESTSHVTVATQGNRELVDKLRKKFNEEAKAVFQMNHPNIVRVLDIFEENGTAYYVMEYIDGKSLNDITKERGALPELEAVGYILQVADALKYVHSLNRLHLDIKPGNIMIDNKGKAILIDFGASKHYDDESGENTSTLMGVNTKGYAPIEQSTKSFTSFSPATDIYALGATLYKLLTGIVPPDANLLLAEEETLQPLPNNISVSTCNAVMAAMQFRRKNRPQSVNEFENLLSADGDDSTKIDSNDDEGTIFDEEPIKPEKEKMQEKKSQAHSSKEDLEDVTSDSSKEITVDIGNGEVWSFNELKNDIDAGGRFVHFYYTISIIFLSFKRSSNVFYLKSNEKAITKSWPYLLISIVFGWWGFPWGIWYTIQSIIKTFSGENVTFDIMNYIEENVNHANVSHIEGSSLGYGHGNKIPKIIMPIIVFAAIVIPIIFNSIEQGPITVTNQIYHLHGEDVSYTGDVEYDVPNGYGTALYKRGQYQGYFVNGMRSGEGTFKDVDGGVFTGIFANDEYSEGRYTMEDGTYYEGTFQNQQPYNGTWYSGKGKEISKVVNGK